MDVELRITYSAHYFQLLLYFTLYVYFPVVSTSLLGAMCMKGETVQGRDGLKFESILSLVPVVSGVLLCRVSGRAIPMTVPSMNPIQRSKDKHLLLIQSAYFAALPQIQRVENQ